LRLVSFWVDGAARPGLWVDDRVVDLNLAHRSLGAGADLAADLVGLLAGGPALWERAREVEAAACRGELATGVHPVGDVRLGPPLPRPGKLIMVGMNYRDHCRENDLPVPERPLIFAKYANAVVGPYDRVVRPRATRQLDYEVELAAVVGRFGKNIPVERALEHVAGYTVLNDISARDVQYGEGQWVRGKTFDTFAPMGPCLITADAVGDPQDLDLELRVNGELRQSSNTRHMVFGVAELVSRISQGITLEPGDVISTGTPAGVGMYRRPPTFLQPGDVVRCGIARIGHLENQVVDESD
jgi:acylpyruvate hydrolase